MVQVVVGRQRRWGSRLREEMDWSVVFGRIDFLLMREESLVAGAAEYYLLRREVDCFEASFVQIG